MHLLDYFIIKKNNLFCFVLYCRYLDKMEGTNNPGFVSEPRKRGLFDTQYSTDSYNNDSNCNTYIETKKNLGDLTIEAMPLEENYR